MKIRTINCQFKFLIVFSVLVVLACSNLLAQDSYIYGYVSDSATQERLPGVNILSDSVSGVASDTQGQYVLKLHHGQYKITFSFLGYHTSQIPVHLLKNDSVRLDVTLHSESVLLDIAVISAGKYEQRISDVTVSIEVMKPAFIQNINTANMEQTLDYVPGLDILDGQASIRGGSGYNYGAGSRVMVLIDDLPILTEGTEEVKWNFLPV